MPKNVLSKPVYIFDDFFFIDENEHLTYDEEYYMIAFKDDFTHCQDDVDRFVNDYSDDALSFKPMRFKEDN